MPAHKGIKRFGEEAISAMLAEYIQLDKGAVEGKIVIDTVNPSTITDEQRIHALNAVNIIIENKNIMKVKKRTCADGSKKRKYLKEG